MTPGPASAAPREASLDLARGFAVLGMIWLHLVPMEGPATRLQHVATGFGQFLEGKSATLFCVLAGMAWAIQAGRAPKAAPFARYLARRAAFLIVVGGIFHRLIWPTEILVPLALMMLVALVLHRAGPRAVLGSLLLVTACPPLLPAHGGQGTVRFLLLGGTYPLLPWLAFPLLGMVAWDRGWLRPGQVRRTFGTSLGLAILGHALAAWGLAHPQLLGRFAAHLAPTWTPATLPFVVLNGSSALALTAALAAWLGDHAAPAVAVPLARLGQASLTHYLLHVAVVYLPLRLAFPGDDWSPQTGATAWVLYLALALPLTTLWFRKFRRGPAESLWAWVSGPSR